MESRIIYTKTDEAPALATASLLPVIEAFTKPAGIKLETRDISLAGRILAAFPEYLDPGRQVPDDLAYLGKLVKKPDTIIIKLPNISASVPQIKNAVEELRAKGYSIPEYPENPKDEKEREIKERYGRVMGSAVNPVLREGNSDRRVPPAVKNYAKKYPHTMGEWKSSSKTRVSSMESGDFYGSEQSVTFQADDEVRAELAGEDGKNTVLIEKLPVLKGEILDSAVMNVKSLRKFIAEEIKRTKEEDILFSVHLKATMMKVSDPVIFGHVVSIFLEDLMKKHGGILKEAGFNPNNGIGDLLSRLDQLDPGKKDEILRDLEECLGNGPELAMVDSEKGITNLHAPNNVIIDASMPAAIRASGKMWGPDGKLKDMNAVIPDRSYAGIYGKTIEFCKTNGAFDPRTMGSVSNVGLMARKAEEYGSHDKTFIIPENGTVKITDKNGKTVMEQPVEKGDIFRMCQVQDEPVRNWVKLAVNRAAETKTPAVFWLDSNRAHDRNLISKVEKYLKEEPESSSLDIKIMSPEDAAGYTLQRSKEGKDTISVTGNVLRDYLTDLFPILEVGTSAKMLSIVPLMNGGGLFETGAGGSAPKHVQQFIDEGHLRWDSLGEILALAAALEFAGKKYGSTRAAVLSETLDKAAQMYLENNKAPSRKTGELDNRGSHFYIALYWAKALAEQNKDESLGNYFKDAADKLEKEEQTILDEINGTQGKRINLNGYYMPEKDKLEKAMRPSSVLNGIIDSLRG